MQLPSEPLPSLPSEEIIIIILIIIIDIIQRPTPVFQAKIKQSERVSMEFIEGLMPVELHEQLRHYTLSELGGSVEL